LFDQLNCPFRHVKKKIRQIELFQDLYCSEEKKLQAFKILDNGLSINLPVPKSSCTVHALFQPGQHIVFLFLAILGQPELFSLIDYF